MGTTNGQAITPEIVRGQVSGHEKWSAGLACYKIEKRGFAPNHELDDWLGTGKEYLLNESNNPWRHKAAQANEHEIG